MTVVQELRSPETMVDAEGNRYLCELIDGSPVGSPCLGTVWDLTARPGRLSVLDYQAKGTSMYTRYGIGSRRVCEQEYRALPVHTGEVEA